MWRGGDGRCHTVAMPDPTLVMTSQFQESLSRLVISNPLALAHVIEEEEQRFYDAAGAGRADAAVEAAFIGVPPPAVLSGAFDTIEGLMAIIEHVDVRWRLDAVMALDDTIGDQEF